MIWLIFALLVADPTTLTGKVVGVTDGDTLTLLVDRTQIKVRLSGIDAPEKGQPFGNRAKQELSAKVFGKEVRVRTRGTDKYGRTLGTVEVDGRDVNGEMVREGWSWSYLSKTYVKVEEEARRAKVGLWADPNPVPPQQWRKRRIRSRIRLTDSSRRSVFG